MAKTAPKKVVKVAKPQNRKRTDSESGDDENRSPNRSSRITPRRAESPPPQDSDKSDVSLDFLGRTSSSSDESNDGNQSNQSTRFSDRTPRNAHRTQANTSQNTARKNLVPSDDSSTNEGRRPRKQPTPRHRRERVFREILKYQTSTELLIQKLPFQRCVREIMNTHGDYRIQSAALLALQESAEYFLVQIFEDCVMACIHRNRVTVNVKDMLLVRNLRGAADPAYEI